ncbi:MAG: class I SAM-dependent methyltransferase, partial [Candidatus Binatia bacterium]
MVRDQPSQTAEAVCWMRASEQRRPPAQRIVDDPYAKLFLGPMFSAGLATWQASGRLGDLAERFSPGLIAWVLTRHRYIDDRLLGGLAAGAEQVVLLGAGYDTRAYRFASKLAGRPVFEVDFPATSRRKAKIVARHRSALPAADVRIIEIDFQTESLRDRLGEAGFRRGARTFFAWEGVA